MEIERKFLIKKEFLKDLNLKNPINILQGYFLIFRIRLKGNKSYITYKSKGFLERREIEFRIPYCLGKMILPKKHIHKTRYLYEYKGKIWELDFFLDDLEGISLAEVELTHKDEKIDMPYFIGEEITHNALYYNENLIQLKKLKP